MGNLKTVLKPFNSLTPDDLDCDLHVHTVATDGKAEIFDIISRSIEIGLKTIAFTEHVRADSGWFVRFADEVRKCGDKSKITVLVGAEARIIDRTGALDISESIRRECDLVLGSVHRFPGPAGGHMDFKKIPSERFASMELELALGFIRQGDGDVLAHPGGMSFKFGPGFPADFMRQILREACSQGMAVEINSAYLEDMRSFCCLAADENPRVSIGSDAHDLNDLGQCRTSLQGII